MKNDEPFTPTRREHALDDLRDDLNRMVMRHGERELARAIATTVRSLVAVTMTDEERRLNDVELASLMNAFRPIPDDEDDPE